jgi:D-3-phosphoglycerate dehydrogenase / 2-oxoglutarate reductase
VKPAVYITEPIPEEAVSRLRQRFDVVLGYGDQAVPFRRAAARTAAVLIRKAAFGAADFARAPRLRVIARAGVGIDNIDLTAAARHRVVVCNVPDGNTTAVAEHVFALLLAVTRRLLAADRHVREGRFGVRETLLGEELSGRRLGLVGAGRIGTAVARIAGSGFGMEVAGFDPFVGPAELRRRGIIPAPDLDALLSSCSVVSVHVPLTPATRELLGRERLALLPPGAILLHTSRGGTVDEAALLEALRSGRLAGAGIDVFAAEPPPADHPLFGLENVVLTPHTAGLTRASLRQLALGAADEIVRVLDGGRPENVVNPA